jgi:glyoxylase-like metal-dependent hydrolase (beta-lactamase superfamily II)
MLTISNYEEVTRFDLSRKILGRGWYWTTAYMVDNLLVDTGCAHTTGELVSYLKGTQLVQIVNTHSHEDHIGANLHLQLGHRDLQISAHPKAVPILTNPRSNQPLQLYRQIFWGWPEPSQAYPVDNGAMIETENYRFEVIYTPGHSPDHICLYEPKQGWLFTGDLFVGGKDRAILSGCDIWQIISSLKSISGLSANLMFPGSARVRKNPRRELKRKIEYLEQTGAKVLEFNQQGISTREITRRVFGGPMVIEFFTSGHFSRRNLVLSYLAKNSPK